ncbi:hypothetical protein [Cellulomonas endometrii]|uniref:hypothetical protein n=1 Tax=Cellulomonas endometrii TaxID=3036301 RepID=UPI0024AE7122|nr:hypothetical protein [Cellulomonas endometrii]
MAMTTPVDPMRHPGRWVITTSSGARHLIDSLDIDHVTVTRLTESTDPSLPGFPLGALRRDDQALRLSGVTHLAGSAMTDGIVVGEDMYLAVEPLGPRAYATVRRTTPVVAIDVLSEKAPDG